MGSLTNIKSKVKRLKRDFNLDTFVETGTAKGDGLDIAMSLGFNILYSVEIYEPFFNEAKKKYGSPCNLLNTSSVNALREWLYKDIEKDSKVFFWLDAHFPSSHHGNNSFGAEENDNLRTPLQFEIEIIAKHRSGNDVILIDDLRMYEDGNYEMGNWDKRREFVKTEGIDFIYDNLSDTHNIKKMYQETGYVLCTPKK